MACFAVIITTDFKVYQTLRKKEVVTYLLFELLLRSGNY
jgi:hypothetical protein